MNKKTTRPTLWTRDFILVFISNLLLFYSFYMLIPVLPFYLMENLGTSGSVAGIVLALYTISALLIRPFSGFIVDMFSRKPLYLICYGFFCAIFAGYVVATTLILFIILRILHGFAFGISTVSGSTVAVDLMVSERRGEGIGYFGMAANLAMAVGPVSGLYIHAHYSFDALFLAAFFSSLVGLFTILWIKPIKKIHPVPATKQALSLDRFILLKALPCVAFLFITGLGYGSVLNYVGVYSEAAPFEYHAGAFFVILSAGIVLARLISARSINKGKIIQMVYIGGAFLILSFALFTVCYSAWILYLIPFLLGIGLGYINPAFQTMFINLAEHNQRGTANATYFTFWDLGIGLGTATGGLIIDKLNFEWLYFICACLLLLGLIYFAIRSAAYFQRNKLR
ncbi:MFS transporter [Parabacteroides sp. PF5-6]|uniref:MFS transporter n=1 Tax=Parabacteroides sp. PF5-6 TaxID=1742403 RepID=UPI002406D87A|nr:MFS transporter [Parabacteroides sp. PF5-6]MDF9830312.1 putative MFS family arabinose efflux permease [Parabacteroides sp. PF5-6]